jgi:hypothetical protein
LEARCIIFGKIASNVLKHVIWGLIRGENDE